MFKSVILPALVANVEDKSVQASAKVISALSLLHISVPKLHPIAENTTLIPAPPAIDLPEPPNLEKFIRYYGGDPDLPRKLKNWQVLNNTHVHLLLPT